MSMTLEQVIADCEEEISDCQIDLDGIMELLDEYPERKAALAHTIDDYKERMDYNRQLAEWLKELAERRKQPEIIHCGECVYYDPPHVENNGIRYEYAEMPKEAFDVLGTGLVSVEYGINVGGRCCVDYYCKNYPDDKRVYVPKDNYCGRAERRTDE